MSDELAKAQRLLEQLDGLRDSVARAAPADLDVLSMIHPSHRLSACNLLHYLALRRHEIRPFQEELAELGVSSLGRAESHVSAALLAVRRVLQHLSGAAPTSLPASALSFFEGRKLLAHFATRLLGRKPPSRNVRIMVTLSNDEAKRLGLVRDLIDLGTNCVLINCAHDSPETWIELVKQVRSSEKELDRSCRILMDLGGPKLRTGPLEPGPPVLRWRPERNRLGQVIRPALIGLCAEGARPPSDLEAQTVVRLSADFVQHLLPSDELELKDARGAFRRLRITARQGEVWLAESHSSAYLTDGTILRCKRSGLEAELLGLPTSEEPIELQQGDELRLTRSLTPGRGAIRDESDRVLEPAFIGCTLGEAISALRPGLQVLIDDGKIQAIVRQMTADVASLEITRVPPKGAKLRSDRGINLPEAHLSLPSLTRKDLEDLKFVAEHADMVGLSFVQRPEDISQLQEHLHRLGKTDLGIVLKIETRRGFENLPSLLWAAMRSEAVGVMIARGDLAVEVGYERLAEVQEEILWLCEAAHLPVIWATQVLETLAKQGLPSRAEITDAAMSERAECVMLNKGPHIQQAVTVLDSILRRMQAHQSKKTSMLRQLHSWDQSPWP